MQNFEPRAVCQNLKVPTQERNESLRQKIAPEDGIKHPQLLNPCIKDGILEFFMLTAEPNVGLHLKTLDVLTDIFTPA